ncbi:MAG: glycoside hydrolase family 15 protein [Chthoniobacterales bacterium]
MSYQPIENYGVVGDLHTVALVGMNGSIDFMCFPHFDSPSIFAAILDDKKGGRFSLAPEMRDVRHRQMYLPDTNILITRFLSQEGIAEVSDFMPVEERGHAHQLIRRAKAVRGDIRFRLDFEPAFNYGRSTHKVVETSDGVVFSSDGPDGTVLRLNVQSDVDMQIEDGRVVAHFKLNAGETAFVIMEDARECNSPQNRRNSDVADLFKETLNFWRGWCHRSTYRGRWREMVKRSALTLKMLVSHPHGAIVAAPTFGLPETLGGSRNWDYRYTWIRDASFTIYGLMRLGYTAEAKHFMNWIEDRCRELADGQMDIMYSIDGHCNLPEETLDHWEGYRKSSPVRIGNAAHNQLQLDIYGELMDSVYLYNKYGEPISYDLWASLTKMIDWVCDNWKRPDEGIWEIRGPKQHFTYSRVLCWVAVDRGVRLALKRSFPAPLDRWLKVRDEIYHDVYRNSWNAELQSFVQYQGGKSLDAACLLMPLVKFIGPTDPRWISTLRAIERTLVEDSTVYRYNIKDGAHDGLEGEEGTFSMCSFWYVECLSRAGDLDKARFLFEKTLGYANHLGLYSEELGPCGEHLGNFPQAFTHLALISAAYNLDQELTRRR